MRRIKARIGYGAKGEVVVAYPKDYLCDKNEIAEDVHHTGDGFIEVALKKGTGRSKGNNFEIIVAKTFSLWLYGNDKVLRRTPLSGGWGSGKLGDITMDPYMAQELKLTPPKVYVECKNYADLLQHSFFRWQCSGDAGLIGGWIADTAMKAKGMPWFLVMKGNGTDAWMLTPMATAKGFESIDVRHKGGAYTMAPLISLSSAYSDHKKLILG